MKMYVGEFYSNGINDLRPRIDYTRYEGYGLIDSIDGTLSEGTSYILVQLIIVACPL